MDEDDFMAALTRAFSEETGEEEAGAADEGGDHDTGSGAA